MLNEPPIKQKWIQWANQEQRQIFKMCKNDREKRAKARELVEDMKETKLHFGRTNKSQTKKSKLPENMLIYLWLLRYMIHDQESLQNAIIFFSADKLPYVEDDKRNVFHPDWIKNNIIIPCMDVYDLLSLETSATHKIFMAHCGLSKVDIRKRIKESILYCMTSDIIKAILSNGWPLDFIAATNNQQHRINMIKSKIQQLNRDEVWPVQQDVFTVFFQAIPYIIENNIGIHWEKMLQHFYKDSDFVIDKAWPQKASEVMKEPAAGRQKKYNPNIDYNPSMAHFRILLPMENENKEIDFLNIGEFLNAIKVGNVTAKQLFVTPEPIDNFETQDPTQGSKRKLRDKSPVNYNEQEQVEGEPGANDDDDGTNKEEDDDNKQDTPNKKRKKGTPKKKKASLKSEEKLKLEKQINENIEDLDKEFEKVNQNLENETETTNVKESIKSVIKEWELLKLRLEKYKH